MQTLRFFFDAGSGTVLWATGAAEELLGYAVDPDRLPIGSELRAELRRLVAEFDTSLNWDYPPDPGPWREPRCRRFNDDVHRAVGRLRAELGPQWSIADEFVDLHEHPDLHR